MRFSISKELITPDYPTFMIGFAEYYNKFYKSVHDDLYVRCFLINDGKSVALMLAFDLLFHDFKFTEKVRDYAARKYGIDPSAVLLSYTHTHYGPAVEGYASELADAKYESFLFERTKLCINKAFLNIFEGTISLGILRADENINRRKLVQGEYIMAPNIEADKDNDLVVLIVHDTDDDIRAILINYSCHPNIRRNVLQLSAEYPGRLCQLLEAEHYGAQAIFFQGCGADSRARVTVDYAHFSPRTNDEVDDMARSLATIVRRSIIRGNVLQDIKLSLRTQTFTMLCPLEVFPKKFFQDEADSNQFEALRACARYVVENYENLPSVCVVHGGVWQLSQDIILIYLGGEICYSTKQMFIREFPDKQIIFLGYADSIAYVPSDQIITEGGYEHEGSVVEYRLKGKFKPGIDKLMAGAVRKCLKSFEYQEEERE